MTTHRRVQVIELSPRQLDHAKAAFTTRRVPLGSAPKTLVTGKVRPRSGDVVLATITRLGHHRHIEQPNGRRAALHLGDQIVVTFADRYATDQFESQVPDSLGRAQLVASGGIASHVLSRSEVVRAATEIMPVGLLGDDRGRPLNVRDFGLRAEVPDRPRPRTIAVIGTSMNSGKTTTICHTVYGLSRGGVKVGVTKVTGTGSGNDYWCMIDAGAHLMLDFTDVGMASTYRQPMTLIERKFGQLVNHLTASGAAVNLVEVADGIFQGETSRLIQSTTFHSLIDAVIFAAPDSMGAAAGVSHLRNIGHNVIALSGLVTRSPLATREAAAATGLPVLSLQDLDDIAVMNRVLGLGKPVTAVPALEPGMRPVVHINDRSAPDQRPMRHRRVVQLPADARRGSAVR
jgi:hypothetical protein